MDLLEPEIQVILSDEEGRVTSLATSAQFPQKGPAGEWEPRAGSVF